jgi:hypothetical protein
VWSFDPETYAIENLSPAESGGNATSYLFTIGHLSYFIDQGTINSPPGGFTVTFPEQKLVIFNHKTTSWKTISHDFPEPFLQVSGFTVDNRGFAGLSSQFNAGNLEYNNKFYEFKPE